MIHCTFEHGVPAQLRHVVVDVLIVNGNREILLIHRSPTAPMEPGKWCLPGGFVDRDESVIEAALREAREETGWQVHITQLVRIIDKPDRAGEDRQNVSFSFLAKPIRQVDKPDDESDKVQWWPLKALPPMAFDHAETVRWVIEHPIQTDFGSMAKHIPWYTFK